MASLEHSLTNSNQFKYYTKEVLNVLGEKNNAMCSYLSVPEIFADFLNGTIFDGKKEVRAESLREHDSVLYNKEKSKDGQIAGTKSRSRDVVKYLFKQNQYLIIGVENQNELHNAMPFRCLEYDVMEYAQQIKQIVRTNKENKKLKNSRDFLSGMEASDKLIPVVTLVFFHGNEPYLGCKSLHEMLEWNHENHAYKKYIADYKMNLILLNELDETTFETGLRDLIGMMKHSSSKKSLQEYVEANKGRISNLDELTYDTIGVMIRHKELQHYKETCKNEEGGIDMCQAILDMIEEGKEQGIELGKAEGVELGIQSIITNMLQKGYSSMQISEITGISMDQIKTLQVVERHGC